MAQLGLFMRTNNDICSQMRQFEGPGNLCSLIITRMKHFKLHKSEQKQPNILNLANQTLSFLLCRYITRHSPCSNLMYKTQEVGGKKVNNYNGKPLRDPGDH